MPKHALRSVILAILFIIGQNAFAQVNAQFSVVGGAAQCGPYTFTFQDQSTGSPTNWEWDFGDGSGKAYNQNPSHSYPANNTSSPKTYTVTLKVSKGSSSDVETKTAYITIHETPQVDFSATPTNGCAPLKVKFTDMTVAGGNGSNTYSWYFGSAGSSTQQNPTFTFPAGTHNVSLTVTNSWGCSNVPPKTKTAYITALPTPVPNFNATTGYCSSPANVIFTPSATGNSPFSYFWHYGDATSGSSSTHSYSGIPKCWSPKLVVTDVNGCVDSVTKTDYICTYDVKVTSTVPTGVCIGIQASFSASGTPSGPAAGTYSWDWGDGSSNTSGASANHTYYSSGSKTVVVTYTYQGCQATATKTIMIYPKPVVNYTKTPDTLCPAPVSVTFNTTGNGTAFEWIFGDNTGTLFGSPITHNYLNNGIFTPRVIATSSDGCKDTLVKSDFVRIYDLNLDAYAPDTTGCKPLTVNFNDSAFTQIPSGSHLYPYPIATYHWDFGDGTSPANANQKNPVHIYTVSGIYKAVLTITTKQGCTVWDTVTIKVGTKPTAIFTAAPTHICNNNYVYFTDLSIDTVNGWEWQFGDGGKAFIQNPPHLYRAPGVYTVKLIANYNTCSDDTIRQFYVTVDSPGANYSVKYSCDTPKKVKFYNQTVGGNSYYWDFGDSQTDTATAPTHIYTNYGDYNTMLIAYNSTSGCHDTMRLQVNLAQNATAFTAIDTAICLYGKARFTLTHTGLPLFGNSWFVDDHFVADSTPTFSYQFNSKGFHKVVFIGQDSHGCRDSIVKNNYIFVSKPTAIDTVAPGFGCVPLTVTFKDNSTVPPGATITSRYWDFGNGTASTTNTSISRTYYSAGQYNVLLAVKDNVGCTDTIVKSTYVSAYKPDASFTVQDSTCMGDTIHFFNTSTTQSSSTAFWDFGDNTTSGAYNPIHIYSSLGSFDVTLIMTDAYGCKDTVKSTAATTTIQPDVSFDVSDSVAVCPPLLVKFTNTSKQTVGPYSWTLGDGNTSTSSATFSNLYTAANYYTVTLVSQNSHGCKDTAVRHISILGYAGSFSYTPLDGCLPLTVDFKSLTTNVTSMTWDFSDGYTSSSVGAATHTYDHAGRYRPKLLYTDAKGCKALSDGLDDILVDDVEPDFLGDAPCQFSTVTLLDTSKSYFSPKVAWKWTFDDGTTSTKQYPKHYYAGPGSYPVKLYVENGRGCKDSIEKDLIIHGLPTISAGSDTIVCLIDSAQLHASGGVSYQWNYSPTLSCINCADPYANPKTDAFYIVTGTDEFNCKNTDTVIVKLKYKVAAIASPDQQICNKQSVTLNVTGGKTYLWMPPAGLDDNTSAGPVASPTATTKYIVVSYEGRCVPDTDQVNVTVYPLPTVKATGEATIVAGNSTLIQATGNLIERFKWEPSESLSCADCPDPTARPMKTTDYKITVFTDHGCQDSDRVRITVLCDESQLFIPNTFSPNGDGMNDVFYPRGTGLDKVKAFRIYSRWGEVLYQKTDFAINNKSEGWDGTFNGNALPPDVFVYVIEAQCEDGKTIMIKGDVTLVR